MTTKDFKLPDLGEGVHEGQIIKIMVAAGDVVREDQPLLEVETDKAAVVIPCPFSGLVQKVHVHEKQMVHVGDVMVTFGESISKPESISSSPRGPATSVAGASGTRERDHSLTPNPDFRAKPQAAIATSTRHKPASPAIRKLARSMGIDIETISGSGPGGRVQRADLDLMAQSINSPLPRPIGKGLGVRAERAGNAPSAIAYSLRPPSPRPSPGGRGGSAAPVVAARVDHDPLPESVSFELPPGEDASDSHGEIHRVSLSQARKTIANVMSQSWTTIPHATDFDDADVTELEQLRKGYTSPESPDRKITLLAFVIRAVVRGLQRFPEFNAHFDAERGEAIYKRYINIAIGVHTERGLVPMVLRDADHLTIPQISDELNIIGEKARTPGGFSVNDTRGGTYTISNAGAMGGSRYSTPIITPGQAAVLAVGRSRWRPWVIEQENAQRGIAPRLIMPLSHSIDHRLLDGGQEVQFMKQVIGDLQNPARLLL